MTIHVKSNFDENIKFYFFILTLNLIKLEALFLSPSHHDILPFLLLFGIFTTSYQMSTMLLPFQCLCAF